MKVIEQKKMRDIMLAESKQKQQNEAQRHRNEEKQRVDKLAAEILEEKNTKAMQKV